jgi:hypothetical protein
MLRTTIRTITPTATELALYSDYVSGATERSRNSIQIELEESLARVYSAKVVGGNKKLVADYKADKLPEELAKSAPFQPEQDGSFNIEAKLKYSMNSTGTTIGASSITSILRELTTYSRSRVYKAAGGEDADAEALTKAIKQVFNASGDAKLFNFLAKYAPITHNMAYNKAKNLTIMTFDGSKIKALEIFFPRSKFTSTLFGAKTFSSSESGISFYYFLNDPFEKALKASIDAATIKAAEDSFKKEVYRSKVTYKRGGVKRLFPIEFSWAHSDSIPMLNVRATITKKATMGPKLPSIIDITQAVQGRVRLKMRRSSGIPQPPKITERSGTFRGSIRAYINTRTKMTNYYYIPYYDALEEYGYDINSMVETSVRAISREKYNIDYSLRRSRN